MTHAIHEPIADAGLSDNCLDCQAKARDPLTGLDRDNLRALWSRMIEVEYLSTGLRYRSHAEAAAADRLFYAAKVMERAGIDPMGVAL